MPKKPINSFNAGELSPYVYARSDLDKYQSGCLTMENYIPLPYGGAVRRPALKYDGASKQDDKIRLIPFTSSVADSYVLELGDQYMRFWQNGSLIDDGTNPIEVDTPWPEADLFDVKFTQSVDVMWMVHPDYPAQRLSRVSSTEWTLAPESFDFPPLLEENDTDIIIAPDALTGDVTLTASRDFFDSDHVGGYFRFDAIRCLDGQNLNGNFSVSGKSAEIYVGGSNWEVSTNGAWLGRLSVRKSDDGGSTWEDYVNLTDTRASNVTGQKNVSFSSDEPEPFGRRLRLEFIEGTETINCSYDLKVDSVTWPTLVKITGYTSATEVVGEIIGEFQDLTSDYTAWTSGASYSVGDKVSISAGINHISAGDVTLTGITGGADLDEVVGCDFGGDQFWFVTEGTSNQKIYKVDNPITQVDASYDISAQFTEVKDIAYYADNLYVSGIASGSSVVKKFTTAGVYVSTEYTVTLADKLEGLGYHNGFFYIGLDRGLLSSVRKFTTSWAFTGTLNYTQTEGEQDDVTGVNDRIYVVNDSNDSIDIYNESLDNLGSVSISGETTAPSGIAYDGENLWVTEFNSGGTAKIYKYEIVEKDLYYECVNAHNPSSATFGTDYEAGYWAERTPEMTTWTEGAFSDYRGHPTSVALFESRLIYGGTATEPETLWMSKIDDFQDFQLGDLDDDGIKLTLGGGQLNEIQWIVPQERLVVGTSGSEWTVGASDERKAITPTGFDLKRITTYGSKNIQGILVNSAVLFLMRQSRKVREWDSNSIGIGNVPPDLSILAEHITEGGITQWDYQQQPDNILWSIRSDGTLLGFTYERDQNVTGWHRHANNEFDFESVAIIPRSDMEDEIWVSVKIVVDGNTKRYIGRLNDREWGSDYLTEWQGLDLYKVYSSPGSATLTGLDYLEGKTVTVVADGVVKDNEVVSSGQITIDSDAYTTVTVGLLFKSTLAPVYLALENQYGTSKGSKTGASKAKLHFKDTYSAKVGQTESDVEAARFGVDDSPLHSGYAEVYMDNANEYLQTCYVVQDEPMPCTVLAMIPEVEV